MSAMLRSVVTSALIVAPLLDAAPPWPIHPLPPVAVLEASAADDVGRIVGTPAIDPAAGREVPASSVPAERTVGVRRRAVEVADTPPRPLAPPGRPLQSRPPPRS